MIVENAVYGHGVSSPPLHDFNLKSSALFRVLLEFDLNIFKKKGRVRFMES
ncbi:hypothetical protein D3C78_1930890 [compost metagenome]